MSPRSGWSIPMRRASIRRAHASSRIGPPRQHRRVSQVPQAFGTRGVAGLPRRWARGRIAHSLTLPAHRPPRKANRLCVTEMAIRAGSGATVATVAKPLLFRPPPADNAATPAAASVYPSPPTGDSWRRSSSQTTTSCSAPSSATSSSRPITRSSRPVTAWRRWTSRLEERPEVLLLDVMMPLARGLEVVRRVRQQEGWHPAIVMISARTRVTDRLNALEAGSRRVRRKAGRTRRSARTINRLLTEVEPARYVDILGPVWATLAIERLAKEAIARRSTNPIAKPGGRRALHRSRGRQPSAACLDRMPTGLERRLCACCGRTPYARCSATRSNLIPVVTDVRRLDALAAVERAIGDETLAAPPLAVWPGRHASGFLAHDVDRAPSPRPLRPAVGPRLRRPLPDATGTTGCDRCWVIRPLPRTPRVDRGSAPR